MIKWPRHEASLTLTHNEHKNYYQTVAESIERDDFGYQDDCWVSPEQRQKAIDTNDCWTLQWYPNTPVCFRIQSAADLDALLASTEKYASRAEPDHNAHYLAYLDFWCAQFDRLVRIRSRERDEVQWDRDAERRGEAQ